MVTSLLSKPLNEHTLIEIESVIANQTLQLNEFYLLTKQQLLIFNELEQYNNLIQKGESFLTHLSKGIDFKIDTEFYYLMFNAYISQRDYKKSYHYYQLRKETLPVIDKYLSTYDVVEFKKLTGQSYEQDLELVLKDELPNNDKINFSLMLLLIYEKNKSYSKMLALSLETINNDPENRALPYYLLSLYELQNYDVCEKVCRENLYLAQYRGICFYYLIKINIDKGDNHQITILDSEYSDYIDELSIDKQKEIFEILIKFYKEIENNKHSENFYTNKLKEVNKAIRSSKKKDNKQESINIIKNVEPQFITQPEKSNLLITQFEIAHVMSNEFIKLSNHNVREFLRLFTIKFSEQINFNKIIVYTTKDNFLYHYNKQRLYDKVVNVEQISKTVIDYYIKNGEEVMAEPEYVPFEKDILTQKEYSDDVKFIYSFPLADLGSVTIYLDYIIKPDQYYDIFKYYSEMIYLYFTYNEHNSKVNTKLETYEKLFNSRLLPLSKLELSFIHYNDLASQIFELSKQGTISDFINELDYLTQTEYKLILKKAKDYPNQLLNITYQYKNKTIEEKLIGIKVNENDKEEIIIFSFYNDLTNFRHEKESLIKKATICELTGLNNLNSLKKQLPSYLETKGSLVLIKLVSDLQLIYGSPKFRDFFKEFAQVTKKHFNELTVYKYGEYELFLYLDANDIRTVDKIIKKYFDEINNYLPVTIPYERFIINASIIRYPVVTRESSIDQLFRFLEVSINRLSNRIDEYNYTYFEIPIYEQEILEQQIIDYINTGIEKNQLDFIFKPIINTTRWTTPYYESILTIPNLNLDHRYIYQVAKQRSKHVSLDRFHLIMILQYLKQLKEETGKLINVIIPIHKETFSQSSFNQFFIKQMKEYKIDGKFLNLKIINNDFNGRLLFNKIRELKLLGVKIGVRNLKENIGIHISQLYFELNQDNDQVMNYLTHINEFSRNDNLAIIVEFVETETQQNKIIKTGIELVSGPLYPNTNPEELFLKIKNQN